MIRRLILPIAAGLAIGLQACTPPALERAEAVSEYRYRIGPGDRLRVTTFNEDRVSGEFTVGSDGSIAFPLLGDVRASGRTLDELKDELQGRLGAEFLRNPRVTVAVLAYRPVYILGEVERPGEYAFVDGMTIYSLVAKAGGFSYRANDKAVYIRREGDAQEQAYALDSGTAVRPGDTVRIGARYF